jgi:FkbM family methyltransferase
MVYRPHDSTNVFAISGQYGSLIPDWISRLRHGDVFLDIGANAGVWVLMAAQQVGSQGNVFAFEPQAQPFADLEANIRANEFGNVRTFKSAVGPISGCAVLTNLHPGHSGIAHLRNVGTNGYYDSDCSTPITLMAGNDVSKLILDAIAGRSCRVGIKIDVEGYEAEVIKSIGTLLQSEQTSFIIIEVCAAHLARFGVTPERLYELVSQFRFFPTVRSAPGDEQYDEVFVRK